MTWHLVTVFFFGIKKERRGDHFLLHHTIQYNIREKTIYSQESQQALIHGAI